MELLLEIPAGIERHVWSDSMNKLVVLHYNEKGDFMFVSCYDIVEQYSIVRSMVFTHRNLKVFIAFCCAEFTISLNT